MSSVVVAGDTSGSVTISAPAVSGSSVLTLPTGTDTLVGLAATQTLTNKSIVATQLTGTVAVANGGTGVATSTGTGANVLGTSPTLATPTFNSAQLATVVGTAPLYMARAWVNFNGTGTVAIRASGNVSSITDNGTGDYTVNITTALSDGNYSIAAMGSTDTGNGAAVCTLKEANQGGINPTTTAFRLSLRQLSGADYDPPFVLATVFR